LGEKFVAEFLETSLIGNFTAHHEQAEGQIGTSRVHSLIKAVDALMQKSIESRGL